MKDNKITETERLALGAFTFWSGNYSRYCAWCAKGTPSVPLPFETWEAIERKWGRDEAKENA
jgi:hypothetical protein